MKLWAVHDDPRHDGTPSGCGWYRIVLPARELHRDGWDITWGARPPEPQEAAQQDVIIAERFDQTAALPWWRRWSLRSKLVYELDDDVWNIPPINWTAWRVYSRDSVRDTVETALSIADMATASTEPLAEIMRKYNDNVHVVPNCVPGELLGYARPEPRSYLGKRDRVTIGWQGGVSHGYDMAMIAGPVHDVLDRHRWADLHLIGADYRRTLKAPTGRFTDWLPVDESMAYYKAIAGFDIGLAPLTGHVFDRSKSNIKALEYAALGIPVIASDVEPYREFVRDGVSGYLARSEADWQSKLRELVNDDAARIEMGAAAREIARSWTIEGNWHRWAEAYKELA